ncbi:hypothetical protein D9M73_83030 [compost metagenome]
MFPLRPPRGLTLASATASTTKLIAASASPIRQASSLTFARVGALIKAGMESSLASGSLVSSWAESPVLVPYSSKSLTFSADLPISFSSRCPFSRISIWLSPVVSIRPERAVVTELLPLSFAAMKTLLLDFWSTEASRSMKKTRLPLEDSWNCPGATRSRSLRPP